MSSLTRDRDKVSEDGTELQNGAADSLLRVHNNQTIFDRLHADMAHTVNQAVSKMETATQQQGKKDRGTAWKR